MDDKQDISKAIIERIYFALPEKTRLFLKSKELQDFVVSLERRYNLSEEESGEIQRNLLLLLLTGKTWEDLEKELTLILRDKSSATIERCIREIEEKVKPYVPNIDEIERALKERFGGEVE